MKRVAAIMIILLATALAAIAWWTYTPDLPRAELEAKYHVAPGDYLTVAGIRLHLRDSGPKGAPAVVLLHGFGSSLDTWDAWAARLSERYRVIRFDLPGFGLTGTDPTGDYSDRRAVEIVVAVLDRLGIARATLIGNSMGGKIAWKAAAAYPDRVEGLVLISPDGFASPGFAYGVPAKVPPLLRLLPYTLPKAMLRANLAPAYGDPARLTDTIVTRYWDMMRAPGVRRALIDRVPQTVLENPEPALRRIVIPVLILWGRKDGMIPYRNAADYQRDLRSAQLVSFAELGHVPQEEDPDRALEPVLTYLAARRASSLSGDQRRSPAFDRNP